MGSHSEDSLDITNKMYKLLIASALAVATALPIEDTVEVQEAKTVFNAASVPYSGYPGVYGYGLHGLHGLNVAGAHPGVYAHGLAYAGYPYAGLPVVKTA